MKRPGCARGCAGLVAIILCLIGRAEAAPPEWLRTAATATGDATAALVLLDDHTVVVGDNGRMSTVRRYAVRVNDLEGRHAALVREIYLTGSGKVKNIRGWLLRDGREVRALGGSDAVDVALTGNDVFNEVRARALSAVDDVRAGDVFGAEIESESSLLYAQLEWMMQDRWPVVLARRSLTLPAGWRTRSVTFNAAPLAPQVQGSTSVWEMRALKEIPEEESMPPVSDLAPRVGVSFFAAPGQPLTGQFESWNDVAGWLDGLSRGRDAQPEAVAARARGLTASAPAVFDKIAAIGRFAQQIQYVSIQTGLGRGGGYQPRAPELVLGRNYGDCKDKANLMRALLSSVGIQSYLVSLYSGDRDYVRPEWPSPQQFNHAIIAVSVPADVQQPAVLAETPVGRVLLFDPTDEFTPVGFLPLHEQGSHALIVDGSKGALLRLPVAAETDHRMTRTVDARLSDGGVLEASVTETAIGGAAADRRALVAALDPAQYRQILERRVAATVTGGRLVDLSAGKAAEAEFVQRMTIAVEHYGQSMGNLLLVRVPFELGDRPVQIGARQRKSPIAIDPRVVQDTVRIALPAWMTLDEMPPEVTIESPFGRYLLRYRMESGTLVAHRSLQVKRATVPVADAAALASFFERIRTADGTPVVFTRR